jgi:hypothetical protein
MKNITWILNVFTFLKSLVQFSQYWFSWNILAHLEACSFFNCHNVRQAFTGINLWTDCINLCPVSRIQVWNWYKPGKYVLFAFRMHMYMLEIGIIFLPSYYWLSKFFLSKLNWHKIIYRTNNVRLQFKGLINVMVQSALWAIKLLFSQAMN